MNKLSLFLLGGAAVLLTTCRSNDPLPAPTQSGQNTLGCLINGKSYIPDGGKGFMPAKPVYGGFFGIQSTPYKVGIYVYTFAKDKQRIELFLNDYRLGTHPLNTTTGIQPAYLDPADYGYYQDSNGNEYVTSQKYTGSVTLIKADTTTGIVAGTFEFTAATPTGQTVSITKGRFDVNARTQ